MAAATLEVNNGNSPNVGGTPSAEFHALWCDLQKVVEQISSVGEYTDDHAKDIARLAALEGVTTLRLAFSRWTESTQYRQFAAGERLAYGTAEQADAPAILDDGLLRMCGRCATEVRECDAIPAPVRKQLHDRLREAEQFGAAVVSAVIAQAAIAERVLKAKAH